jgi:hypothetical protein
MRALHPHRPIPGDAQPSQIFGNRRSIFRPAPPLIDILQPEQKPLPPRARKQRREGVAKMQIASRARGEAGGVVHAPILATVPPTDNAEDFIAIFGFLS